MVKVDLPFTGIATFFKLPPASEVGMSGADAVLFGIPYDCSVGFRPGARFGPRAIRDMSVRYSFTRSGSVVNGYFDLDLGRKRLSGRKLVDAGDVDIVYTDISSIYANVDTLVREVLDCGAMPVAVGGDHSITYPVVRALDRFPSLSILHLDSHLDFKDSAQGFRFSNSSPMKRVSELRFVSRIVTVGARGPRTSESDYHAALERGNVVIPASRFKSEGAEAVARLIPSADFWYVSIDIDVLDPSLCPGTGSPEAGGLSMSDVVGLIRRVCRMGRIVGLDLVEVNPYLDPAQVTSLTAARLLLESLAEALEPA